VDPGHCQVVGGLGRTGTCERFQVRSLFVVNNSPPCTQRNTLLLYLLDELHYYEDGHADTLRPIQQEVDRSFLGEHRDLQPVTLGDLKGFMKGVEHTVTTAIQLAQTSRSLVPSTPPASTSRAGEHRGPNSTVQMFRPDRPTPSLFPANTAQSGQILAGEFPPGLCIPKRHDVPKEERWLAYVRDWEESDPERGLVLALKDWPEKWYTGQKRLHFASLRNTRKLIAEEFIIG